MRKKTRVGSRWRQRSALDNLRSRLSVILKTPEERERDYYKRLPEDKRKAYQEKRDQQKQGDSEPSSSKVSVAAYQGISPVEVQPESGGLSVGKSERVLRSRKPVRNTRSSDLIVGEGECRSVEELEDSNTEFHQFNKVDDVSDLEDDEDVDLKMRPGERIEEWYKRQRTAEIEKRLQATPTTAPGEAEGINHTQSYISQLPAPSADGFCSEAIEKAKKILKKLRTPQERQRLLKLLATESKEEQEVRLVELKKLSCIELAGQDDRELYQRSLKYTVPDSFRLLALPGGKPRKPSVPKRRAKTAKKKVISKEERDKLKLERLSMEKDRKRVFRIVMKEKETPEERDERMAQTRVYQRERTQMNRRERNLVDDILKSGDVLALLQEEYNKETIQWWMKSRYLRGRVAPGVLEFRKLVLELSELGQQSPAPDSGSGVGKEADSGSVPRPVAPASSSVPPSASSSAVRGSRSRKKKASKPTVPEGPPEPIEDKIARLLTCCEPMIQHYKSHSERLCMYMKQNEKYQKKFNDKEYVREKWKNYWSSLSEEKKQARYALWRERRIAKAAGIEIKPLPRGPRGPTGPRGPRKRIPSDPPASPGGNQGQVQPGPSVVESVIEPSPFDDDDHFDDDCMPSFDTLIQDSSVATTSTQPFTRTETDTSSGHCRKDSSFTKQHLLNQGQPQLKTNHPIGIPYLQSVDSSESSNNVPPLLPSSTQSHHILGEAKTRSSVIIPAGSGGNSITVTKSATTTAEVKCPECFIKLPDQFKLKRHARKVHKDPRYACKACFSGFTNRSYLAAHIWMSHYQPVGGHRPIPSLYYPASCPFCPGEVLSSLQFDSEKLFKEHVAKDHPEKEGQYIIGVSDKQDASSANAFNCTKCLSKYLSYAGLTKHFAVRHILPNYRFCIRCGILVKDKDNAVEHGLRLHPQDNEDDLPWEIMFADWNFVEESGISACDICDSVFSSVQFLAEHQQKGHPTLERILTTCRFQCGNCSRRYSDEMEYKGHMAEGCSFRNKICFYCARIFKSREEWKEHLKIQHWKLNLIYHSVTDEELYKCEFCKRRFSHVTGLHNHFYLEHMEKPTPEVGNDRDNKKKSKSCKQNPFSCPQCPASFSNPLEVRKHLQLLHEMPQCLESEYLPTTQLALKAVLHLIMELGLVDEKERIPERDASVKEDNKISASSSIKRPQSHAKKPSSAAKPAAKKRRMESEDKIPPRIVQPRSTLRVASKPKAQRQGCSTPTTRKRRNNLANQVTSRLDIEMDRTGKEISLRDFVIQPENPSKIRARPPRTGPTKSISRETLQKLRKVSSSKTLSKPVPIFRIQDDGFEDRTKRSIKSRTTVNERIQSYNKSLDNNSHNPVKWEQLPLTGNNSDEEDSTNGDMDWNTDPLSV